MARSKLTSKNTKSEDENDIKILLATTLISILLAAFLFNILIHPAVAISSDETVVPEEQKPDIVRVKEKVGEKILWTPALIVTSPPKGSAIGETKTTTKATYIMGTLGYTSEKGVGEGTGAEDGEVKMICYLAKWAVYHVYDKDRYTGAIWKDYGYHAEVIDWEPFGHLVSDTILLDKEKDYRFLETKTEWNCQYGTYETVEVNLRYQKPYDDPDEEIGTTGGERWRTIEGKNDVILDVEAKVKISNYVSVGAVKLTYTCSASYYFKYYFPKGHWWRIDYLGPTGTKLVWTPWPHLETKYPLYAFILDW
ncbi:MAG: hypothetical protein ACTSYM_08565 [Candidatus Baldrarchaeia archaeon]